MFQMPSRAKMRSSSAKRTSMLAHCGNALAIVTHTRYSPFHDLIRRSMRSTRSMRRMRRKERLAPPGVRVRVRVRVRVGVGVRVRVKGQRQG